MRNLKRLHSAGIPCPEPHLLKSHVLVMEFLGNSGGCPYVVIDNSHNDIAFLDLPYRTSLFFSESFSLNNRLVRSQIEGCKMNDIKEQGFNPFEYTYKQTHKAVELQEMYKDLADSSEDEQADVAVAGTHIYIHTYMHACIHTYI